MKNQKKITRGIALIAFMLLQMASYAQFTFPTGTTGTTGSSGFSIPSGPANGIMPSAGDDVCKATPLKASLSCVQYSNDTASKSSTPVPSCWSDGIQNDVWFSFTALSQDMTISTDAIIFELFGGTTCNDTEIALYQSNDGTCNSITELGCDQDNGINSGIDLSKGVSGPTRQGYLQKTGLIPGNTYFIRVQNQGSAAPGNFCVSASDTYTPGSKPCEAQDIRPNQSACSTSNGNAVVNTTSQPPGGAVVKTIQPGAYVPLGQTWACSPAKANQYGTWTTWTADTILDVKVTNNSGNAVDYTLFTGICTLPHCVSSQPCAVGGNVSFSGITKGTKYYILTTLQGGDTNPVVKTDLCITNGELPVHPPTAKNLGGVKDSGGTQQSDQCPAFEITADQVYSTTLFAAPKAASGAPCSYGRTTWFTWKVPSTYPTTNGVAAAFFQMWNKNCTDGPGSIGTRLIVGAALLGDPCSGSCLEFSSPSQTGAAGSSGDLDPYTTAPTNVGWNPDEYGNQYWGMFQSGNDGSGNATDVCDFNFMIGSTPSLKGITIADQTICQGQSIKLTASGGTAYEWATGETTTSITVTPPVSTSYTVTATAGADGYAVGNVTVIPYPFTVSATPGAICSGANSATLTATSSTTSTLTPSYVWTPSTKLDVTTGATVHASPTATTTYTVTSTIGAYGTFPGCKASTPVTVTVGGSIPVTVNSGAACPGVGASLTASGGITYTWTPTTNLSASTGTTVTASPPGTTTYTVTGENNGCKGTATATVTISSTPTITVNSPSICSGNTATLTASGGSTYIWLDASGATTSGASLTTAVLNAPASYTVTGTSASGCSAKVTATVSINSGLNIVVSASNGGSFCPAGPVGAGGSTTLSATGATTYTWTPATGLSATNGASVTATPTVTTTYSVNGSDAGGCLGSSTQLVTVLSLDDATFSYSSAAYCAPNTDNATTTVSGGAGATFAITPASGILNTSTGALNIITGTTVGPYTIKYTTANQCPNSYTVGINVVANPDATFSYDAPSYCNNAATAPVLSQPAGSTKGNFSASPAGLTVNATTGAITLASSTANTYTVTNSIPAGGGCLAISGTTVITVNPVPVVTSTSTTVCAGTSGTITASGATSYAWSGFPAGATLTDSPANTTTYTVTGTSNGCSSTGTGSITINQNPVVGVIPPPAAVCPGFPATLTASGATSYVWTGGPGGATATLTDSPATTSTYTVTGTSGICTGTATGVITVGAAPNITTADASICSGSTGATLTANGGITYSWSTTPPQTTASINVNPLTTTTYTVTGTGPTAGCNGVAYATVVVNTTPAPAIAFAPGTICVGQSSTITAYPAGAASYVWSSGGPGSPITVSPLVTTLYTVTVTSTAGCFATTSGSLVVIPVAVVGVNNATICSGQTAKLTATGATSYAWLPNIGAVAAVTTPTLTTSSTYTVTGNAATCPGKAVAMVTVNPSPSVVVNSQTICLGEKTTLTASGAITYSWSPVSDLDIATGSSVTADPKTTTTYTVTGTSVNGCIKKVNSTVLVHGLPIINPSSDITILLYTSTPLLAAGGGTYTWTPSTGLSCSDCPTPIASPTVTTTYCVKVKDSNNCIDSACVTVGIEIPCPSNKDLAVPNAFSPNGDGQNDIMILKGWGECITDFTFIIYDRWGEKVFESNDPYKTWDGTFRGQPLDPAVFVYFINASFSKGEKVVKKGNISLIR